MRLRCRIEKQTLTVVLNVGCMVDGADDVIWGWDDQLIRWFDFAGL
jgi:hypothetical protein